MAMDGSKIAVVLACLTAVVAGCAVPPVPESASSDPYGRQTTEDGWLFSRLTGRDSETPPEAPEAADDSVRQATAEEPVYPPQGSVGPVPENIENALHTTPASGEDGAGTGDEEEEGGFSLSDLAPTALYNQAKEAAGYGRDEKLARQLFDEGQELYRQKKYEEAADKFQSAAARWPDSTLEEDAQFYRGESLFFANQFTDASDVFGELMKKYENSRYLDQAARRQFNIGRYWEKVQESKPLWPVVPNVTDSTRPLFDTWGNALKAYESVQLRDPTGPLADDAVMAIGNAYFVKGRYEDAAYHYDVLRKQYPKSEHQYEAHRLAVKSKMLMYQGPFYDGTSLVEAGEIADQTLRQFRREIGDDRERVLEEKNAIVEKLAQREWEMGQYYDTKGYFGAARLYYQALLDDTRLCRTTFAGKAQKRLDEIKSLPDKPTNHFQWLTNLFPTGS